MPRSYAFNKVVGADTKKMPSLAREPRHCWLSVICWGVTVAMITKTSTAMATAAS